MPDNLDLVFSATTRGGRYRTEAFEKEEAYVIRLYTKHAQTGGCSGYGRDQTTRWLQAYIYHASSIDRIKYQVRLDTLGVYGATS